MMKRFYAINELPKNKWIKIIGTYERMYDNEVIWYYEEEIEK